MAGTTRIEELQKKFDENPRRYFAPLANEYRKAGDIDQAIAICQEYLPQQPGHMSGHIVYGQALFEARRFDDAREVFETALSLDPENLIALRHLGDISRENGDPAAARGWYQRVLDADPRNEEIGTLIAELDTMPSVSSSAPTPISTPTVRMSPIEEQPAISLSDQPTVEIPRMGGAPRAPEPEVEYPLESEPEQSELPDLELPAPDARENVAAAPPPIMPPIPEAEDIPLELPSEIFEPTSYESAASAPPSAPPDFRLSLAIESAAGVEPVDHEEPAPRDTESVPGLVPTQFDDPGSLAGLEPTSFDEHASADTEAGAESMGVTSAFEMEMPAASPPSAETPASGSVELPFITDEEGQEPEEERAPARHTPSSPAFVTETMAELYLRQGHRAEAIEVYRQLISQRPDDAALKTRLEEVEHGAASASRGPSIRDFLGALATRKPSGWDDFGGDDGASTSPEHGAEPSAAAHVDAPDSEPAPRAPVPASGQSAERHGSIDALFPGREASATDAAAAARLAQAFANDEIGARDEALAGAPARKATTELSLDHVFRERGATPNHGQPSFSFDQFFAQGASAHDDALASEHGAAAGGAPDDDIQQFNDWLEGLKKS